MNQRKRNITKKSNEGATQTWTNKVLILVFLLSSFLTFADELDDFLNIPGGGNDPANTPIDNPYFWVLLFLIGGYIAYKKLQPKTI